MDDLHEKGLEAESRIEWPSDDNPFKGRFTTQGLAGYTAKSHEYEPDIQEEDLEQDYPNITRGEE